MCVQRRVVFVHLIQMEEVGVLRVRKDIESVAARFVARGTFCIAKAGLPELVRVPSLMRIVTKIEIMSCASQSKFSGIITRHSRYFRLVRPISAVSASVPLTMPTPIMHAIPFSRASTSHPTVISERSASSRYVTGL